ncbi:hypothetical protein BCLUESOX_1520 [bacterium endosymbiont of Bathymodiolus sp. 5 South]|nr:hypothetical protein BCLUESOX_1520 [bacterium endosymbiont of Bathymodiolus sp. 5 South]
MIVPIYAKISYSLQGNLIAQYRSFLYCPQKPTSNPKKLIFFQQENQQNP